MRFWTRNIIILCLVLTGFSAQSAPSDTERVVLLQQAYDGVSADVFSRLTFDKPVAPFSDLLKLREQVEAEEERGNALRALSLIYQNMAVIKEGIDERHAAYLLQVLLKHNQQGAAEELYRYGRQFALDLVLPRLSFLMAEFAFRQGDWQKVVTLLKGQFTQLVEADTDRANLIAGVALQKLKQHREAANYFQKISEKSSLYAYAQINLALVTLRQGWWADARVIIKQLLDDYRYDMDDELVNRSFLIVGYGLLEREFYRDARETFRFIEKDSAYATRALLGIALAAISQEDYASALSVLSHLNKLRPADISIDESYLVLAYAYTQLDRFDIANKAYNEAITYYEQRKSELVEQRQATESLADVKGLDDPYLYQSWAVLRQLKKADLSSLGGNSLQQFEKVYAEFQTYRIGKKLESLDTQIKHIESYISQSKYGLALMFDNLTAEEP